MKKTKHLTAYERDMIGFYLGSNESKRSIARKLGRGHSTIASEIKRNSINKRYLPIQAHEMYLDRKRIANSLNPRKEEKVWDFVVEKLKNNWAPELISGRLRYILYPDDKSWWISTECIYDRIYSKRYRSESLWKYLPRKHNRRKSKYRGRRRGSKIPDRVSISQRGEEIDSKETFGHWEGDSVLGKGRKSGLHTEVERKSRYLEIRKISRVNSQKSINAQLDIFKSLPEVARKSDTLDNGVEFVKHAELHKIGMKTYFAHPYCSWERGSNEWHNGLIRRYCPKGTDFNRVTNAKIQNIQDEINDRPRKILNYETPREVFEKEIESESVRVRT